MNILLDTHALFWFLSGDKRLPNRTRSQIETASRVFIPTIVLLELFYLIEKKNVGDKFTLVLQRLRTDERFTIVSLDIATVQVVTELPSNLEIHDRVILASAKILGVPIVTKDQIIQQHFKNTMW